MRIIKNLLSQESYKTMTFGTNKNHSKNDVKVSVILPIYNQEKYIGKALDSLRNQTLEETEFICVNDGSDATKDRSLEILKEYANKDSRVKIIDQPNQGTGRSRNNGIKAAQGKYLAFLDPDDWFDKNALETAFTKAEERNCDMLVFDYKIVEENSGKTHLSDNIGERIKRFYPEFHKDKNFNWKNIKPVSFRALFWMAWNKIYNRQFVQNSKLAFSDCNLAEDNAFVFGATLKAKDIGYLDQPLYNYLIHDGSAIRKVSDKNLCIFKAIEDVKNILCELNLTHTLKNEFDFYVLKLMELHTKQIQSQDKLIEMCLKHLPKHQIDMINEQNIIKGLKNIIK